MSYKIPTDMTIASITNTTVKKKFLLNISGRLFTPSAKTTIPSTWSRYPNTTWIAAGEGYEEMDMTYYGVEYNEDGSFTLTIRDVFQDMTLDIIFESENAEDITIKKYVITENNDTPEKVAEALAREFGFITYAVNPAGINVENIDLSGIAEVGYGTFDFSVTVGGVLIEDQGFIVPTHEHILFDFDGTNDGEPVNEIRVLTPADIEDMIFGVPAMDSGSIRLYGVNGIRFEGVLSSDVHDAFIGGTRIECIIGRAFYRAQWHISNSFHMDNSQALNLFSLNLIQDNAFCVEVAASSGEGSLPAIPGVTTYTLELPASSLSKTEAGGALALSTDAGTITIPDNSSMGQRGYGLSCGNRHHHRQRR